MCISWFWCYCSYSLGSFVSRLLSLDFGAFVASNLMLVPVYSPAALNGFGVGVVNGSLWTFPVEVSFSVVAALRRWPCRWTSARPDTCTLFRSGVTTGELRCVPVQVRAIANHAEAFVTVGCVQPTLETQRGHLCERPLKRAQGVGLAKIEQRWRCRVANT